MLVNNKIIFTCPYFLLDTGEVIYSSKGIDEDTVLHEPDGYKIYREVQTTKGKTNMWCRIVASAATLTTLEKFEKEFFLTFSEKIKVFYLRLSGKRYPNLRSADMVKHYPELMNFNKIRIIDAMREEEQNTF